MSRCYLCVMRCYFRARLCLPISFDMEVKMFTLNCAWSISVFNVSATNFARACQIICVFIKVCKDRHPAQTLLLPLLMRRVASRAWCARAAMLVVTCDVTARACRCYLRWIPGAVTCVPCVLPLRHAVSPLPSNLSVRDFCQGNGSVKENNGKGEMSSSVYF